MRPLPPPLPAGVRRLLVAGGPGAGKTTLARALGARLGLPYTELDALAHGPGWTPRPEFDADVDALAAAPCWVTEYQYPSARPRLLAAADAVVWLDHSWPLVAARVLRRSVARTVGRQRLFNGNVERLRTWAARDHPLRVVASPRFRQIRQDNTAEFGEAVGRGVVVVRLRGGRPADRWLARA